MLKCVFLDRDGVLTPDPGGLPKKGELPLIPGIIDPLNELAQNEFALIIITNQPQVARGLATEEEVNETNQLLMQSIEASGGPNILSAKFCPHHPNADLVKFRVICGCRKPKPGMLIAAAKHHTIDLTKSYLIGDRVTDIAAGGSAGCRTVLLNAGDHTDRIIETNVGQDEFSRPDFACETIAQAVEWIIENSSS